MHGEIVLTVTFLCDFSYFLFVLAIFLLQFFLQIKTKNFVHKNCEHVVLRHEIFLYGDSWEPPLCNCISIYSLSARPVAPYWWVKFAVFRTLILLLLRGFQICRTYELACCVKHFAGTENCYFLPPRALVTIFKFPLSSCTKRIGDTGST